jgi:integrase
MIIERLEERDAHQVVTTVRQCCMSILAFAARSGFTDRVIAVKRKTTADMLPAASVEERLVHVGRLIDALGPAETRLAMNLLLLLLVPPQELCRAEWRNIDLVAGEWTIPATARQAEGAILFPWRLRRSIS